MILFAQSSWQSLGLGLVLFGILFVPFARKPVHVDDANFLLLAEGVASDPWRPHAHEITWSGVRGPAFNVLANPPGIAWYLAPLRHSEELWLHLAMLPWLALGLWGANELARHTVPEHRALATAFVMTCPVVVLSAQALTPDLPLFACLIAGVAGFGRSGRSAWLFALLAGSAALFRYSGIIAIPLILWQGWLKRGWRGIAEGLPSIVPITALALHDLHAYDQVHLLAMFAAQNDTQTKALSAKYHDIVAGLAMLGGAVVLPVVVWNRIAVAGAVLGAMLGFDAALLSGQSVTATVVTCLFAAAGGAAISNAVAPKVRDPFLSGWAIAGLLFFATVRFAATRYWIAFLPAVAFLAVRNVRQRPGWLLVGIAVNVVLAFCLAVDDQNLARVHQEAARRVAKLGTGSFSGHWGWQHYLAQAGWVPTPETGKPEALHAFAWHAAPRVNGLKGCLELVERFVVPDTWPGPRTSSICFPADYHSGTKGRYAPWIFSNEPYDVISVYRECGKATSTSAR